MPKEWTRFFFDVEKWRGSLAIQRMTFSERGVYKEMLNEQWLSRERSLPDDPQAVADLIALTPAHVAEVLAAWPVVRRKFVLCRRDPSRIYNIKLEAMRRQQRANHISRVAAGRIAGKASAAKRRITGDIPSNQSLTTVERSSTEKKREEESRADQRREEGISRASVLAGSLPRDHQGHVFCDPTFTVCVPSAVHAKFIGPMSRRFDGDREQAHQALQAWYADVAAGLPADFVPSDWFKFWQPRFDAAFASENAVVPQNKRIAGLVAGGQAFLNRRQS